MDKNLIKKNYIKKIKLLQHYNQKYYNENTSEITDVEYDKIKKEIIQLETNNTYLEHAAKILRHDMHSGINTYIPRGVSSLEKRLTDDNIKELKIESPLKMIKEGLLHTQKVYKGVYEFTNLVKKDSVIMAKTSARKSN